jgi:hypothetical protein
VQVGKSLARKDVLEDLPDLAWSVDRIHPAWAEALRDRGAANRGDPRL